MLWKNFFSFHLSFLSFQGRTTVLRLAYWVSFHNDGEEKVKESNKRFFFSYECDWFDSELLIYLQKKNQLVQIQRKRLRSIWSPSHHWLPQLQKADEMRGEQVRQARNKHKRGARLSGEMTDSKAGNQRCQTFLSVDQREPTGLWRGKLLASHGSAISAALYKMFSTGELFRKFEFEVSL